jgi:hypothetical protein
MLLPEISHTPSPNWEERRTYLQKISTLIPLTESLNPEDRISRLSNEVLCNFMVMVSPKEVCRMACSSKKFYWFCKAFWRYKSYDTAQTRLFFVHLFATSRQAAVALQLENMVLNSEIETPEDFDENQRKRFLAVVLDCKKFTLKAFL